MSVLFDSSENRMSVVPWEKTPPPLLVLLLPTGKLSNRGDLPGHKVGTQWHFARAEINRWIETQMSSRVE